MEVIGGHCASTAVFVNAHHSIGIRALVLFGTPEQKARWLPALTSGEKLAAFALTEEQAGSDASNVQTTATPSADGRTYVLNGTKRYITNGAIADVLTVMARTPDPKGGESKITAFLVTPDLPGFQVVEPRMAKCGIRGTATAKLAFHDMPVPAANILGPVGKGLRVGLTVLDFGRTTFGASCTGMAKFCLAAATMHAARRQQFGRPWPISSWFKKKLAYLAATAYAMEATTYETAALIDRGTEDYMLETAILKVFSTEALWQGVYETPPGARRAGLFHRRTVRADDAGRADQHDRRGGQRGLACLHRRGGHARCWPGPEVDARRAEAISLVPAGPLVLHPRAHEPDGSLTHRARLLIGADQASRLPGAPGSGDAPGWSSAHPHDPSRGRAPAQLILERIASAAIALVTASCTLARLDAQLTANTDGPGDHEAAELYLRMAFRRCDESLHSLKHNDDEATLAAASAAVRRFS